MSDKFKFIRFCIYILEILIFYVLEETPNLFDRYFGIKPVFIISIAILVAMFEGQFTGLFFGIFAGTLMDIGLSYLIGFNALILGTICFFVGLFCVSFIKVNLLTSTTFSLIGIVVVFLLQFLFMYLFRGFDYLGYTFIFHYLPLMLYAFIPTPLFFLIHKGIYVRLKNKI